MFVDDILDRAARLAPMERALVCGDAVATFAELNARVGAKAAWLGGKLALGSRVAVLAANSIEYMEWLYAIPRAAMIAVPLNYRLHPREWCDQLDRTETALVLGDPSLLDQLPASPRLTHRFGTALGETQVPAESARDRTDTDVAWLLFTSGTTGTPKGAMLTHRNLGAGAISGAFGRPVHADDISLFAFPLCHIAAYNVLIHHLHARPVVLMRRFDPTDFLTLVARHRVTTATLAPTMIDQILHAPQLHEMDLASLRLIGYGSSPIPASVMSRASERLACDFSQGYGMTELSGNAVFMGTSAHRRAANGDTRLARAAGYATPVITIRVVDDEGTDVARGDVGEIVARGDQVTVGYWRAEPETRAAFVDGWFRTGDLGRLDADGLITIVDRKKDVIVSGGENVASREVEQVLESLPGVREVAVVGVADDRWGEVVAAVVVRTSDPSGTALGVTNLTEWSRSHLAGYKTPRRVWFVDALPKNSNGKIDKRATRALVADHFSNQTASTT